MLQGLKEKKKTYLFKIQYTGSLATLVVPWVLLDTLRKTLLGWHRSFICKKHKKVWTVALLCSFWTIWKKRNGRLFENEEQFTQILKNTFLSLFDFFFIFLFFYFFVGKYVYRWRQFVSNWFYWLVGLLV